MKEPILDIRYGDYPECKLDLYIPDCPKATFIYFHGGGLESGDKGFKKFFPSLLDEGIGVVSVEYRMYPTHKYPDFIEDCAKSVKWTMDNVSRYGGSDKIFVGGSSAGGYLSMMLLYCDEFLKDVGVDVYQIKGFVLDAGQPTTHFNVLKYTGVDSRRVIIDERAPMYYVGLRESYPPCMYIVSDHDMANRYEQTMLMLSTLKHFGVDTDVSLKVMHGDHCHYVEATDDKGEYTFANIIRDFINPLLV